MSQLAKNLIIFVSLLFVLVGQTASVMAMEMADCEHSLPLVEKKAANNDAAMNDHSHSSMSHESMSEALNQSTSNMNMQDCCDTDCQCPMNMYHAGQLMSFGLNYIAVRADSTKFITLSPNTFLPHQSNLYRPPIFA